MNNQHQIPNVANAPDSVRLGQLITGDAARDAIHVAVAPVVAGEDLNPGDRVGIHTDGKVYKECRVGYTGVVDPYLPEMVREGERFWLFLKPGSVTSLRHVWTHPAFSLKVPERKITTGKCPECHGRGGHLEYEPGLFNETCTHCKGTGIVEVKG